MAGGLQSHLQLNMFDCERSMQDEITVKTVDLECSGRLVGH